MDRLRPCPKCKSDDIRLVGINCEDREGTPKALQCLDCGWIADGGIFPSEISDITYNWNHRVVNGGL